MQKLYKIDSKGKIREWSISTGDDGGTPYYSVSHGVLNGALQTTKVMVPKGKNLGRANATTAEEQCAAEAKSLWEKQRDRKGYSEKIPTEKPLRPMLAKKWENEKEK